MSIGNHPPSIPASLLQDSASPLRTPARGGTVSVHAVQFYEEDEALITRLSEFVGSALGAGRCCLIVVTPSHRNSLLQRLVERDLPVDRMMDNGRFIVLDAAETLKLLMVNDWPDGERFSATIGGLLSQITAPQMHGSAQPSVFGEMVALLWADGKADAAIRLEQLWNDLGKKHFFSLLCAYPMHGFGRKEDETPFRQICAEHSSVVPCESYGTLSDESEKLLTVSELQQKAQMLQAVAEERQQLALQLSDEVEELRKLHGLSIRIMQLKPQQIMQEVLFAVGELHHADLGLISIRYPLRDELEPTVSLGFRPEFLEIIGQIPSGDDIWRTCLANGKRVTVEDTEVDPAFVPYLDASRNAGFRGMHSTPLMNRSGNLLGVLTIYFRDPYTPSLREVRLTDLYAHLAANAIESSHLLRETQLELARRTTAEEALRESEEFSRNIVESTVDCIKLLDLDGRLIYMSPPGQRALGIIDVNSVLNRRWTEFWDPADEERASAAIAEAHAGHIGHFEGSLTIANQTTWWDVKIAPMYNSSRKIARLLAISREITSLKLAQTALMQAEKLAAAGRLAATIAHEINNPLEAVTNFIYLAKTAQGLPQEVYRQLDIADQELARVGHIAQQTLGFYRDTSSPQTIQLEELIKGVVSIYERRLKYKRIRLDQQLEPDLNIFGRKGDLKQVLSNLLTNAIDASPNHGNIIVRIRKSTDWQNGAPGVRITVADSGTGMSPETRAKAFSAFFTTKAEVGTGIGLWVTRNILEASGGAIRCRSSQKIPCGTVMSMFLPLELRSTT